MPPQKSDRNYQKDVEDLARSVVRQGFFRSVEKIVEETEDAKDFAAEAVHDIAFIERMLVVNLSLTLQIANEMNRRMEAEEVDEEEWIDGGVMNDAMNLIHESNMRAAALPPDYDDL